MGYYGGSSGSIVVPDGSVTTDKLADQAVTAQKISDGAVGLSQLAPGIAAKHNVTYYPPGPSDDESQGYSVGSQWFDTNTAILYVCTYAATSNASWYTINSYPPDDSVSTSKLQYGAVTTDKIASCAITIGQMDAGSVGSSQLQNNAVYHDAIDYGAVWGDKLAAPTFDQRGGVVACSFDATVTASALDPSSNDPDAPQLAATQAALTNIEQKLITIINGLAQTGIYYP